MSNAYLELFPLRYGESIIKTHNFVYDAESECFSAHWHNRMELLLVKKGEMVVENGRVTYALSCGQLMIVPPRALHKGYTQNSSVEYDVLMLDVRQLYNDTEVARGMLSAVFDGRAVFNPITENEEIIACVESVCKENDNVTLETMWRLYRFFALLYENELVELCHSPKNSFVTGIIDYIEKNAVQEVNIGILCEHFSYSPAQLCRKFKKETGVSPMTYLKIYRLDMARKKLANSEGSISTVATECGFTDSNYFSRCFKAHFGMTPFEYSKYNKM